MASHRASTSASLHVCVCLAAGETRSRLNITEGLGSFVYAFFTLSQWTSVESLGGQPRTDRIRDSAPILKSNMDTRKRPSFYYHGIPWFSTNFLSRVARSMGALQVRIARLPCARAGRRVRVAVQDFVGSHSTRRRERFGPAQSQLK